MKWEGGSFKKASLNPILFISLHDSFTAQNAGSVLDVVITFCSKGAFKEISQLFQPDPTGRILAT